MYIMYSLLRKRIHNIDNCVVVFIVSFTHRLLCKHIYNIANPVVQFTVQTYT